MPNEFRLLNGAFLRMDLRDFSKLYAFFLRYPIAARKATAQFLNDLAFAWRPLSVSVLASRMIMRSPRFILSRMQVVKTSALPIARQAVTVGSTYVRGKGGKITFDGFRSLQGLGPEEKSRTMTLFARGGDKAGIAKRSAKLMPGTDIPSTDDSPVLSGSRAQFLIRDMAKNATNKTFIIKRGYGMAPGLYRIAKGKGYLLPSGRSAPKLQIVQHFGKTPHAHTWHWMQDSIKRLLTHAPMAKMWNAAISRVTADALHKQGIPTTRDKT